MAVKKGNKVKVEYVGMFETGEIFDSSENHGKPLEFEVGAGQMIPGFDEAVLDMNPQEEKEITLSPDRAYGEANPEMMKTVPLEQLPKGQEPKLGMILGIQLPNGQQFPARISKVAAKEVTIDLNHPLAGKTLKFKLKLVSVHG